MESESEPVSEVLAIDGPAGVGKSTVSAALAERLGLRRLDTGAIYRAVTAAVLRDGSSPANAQACTRLADSVTVLFGQDGSVLLDGNDVTAEIRTQPVTDAVSTVSSHPGVRRALVRQQRSAAVGGGWIVEGRDIGTVVFPDARLKVFLTASAAERARRRADQTGETDVAAVESDIERRDVLDSNRADSPLRPAEDAVIVDTTDLDFAGVVDRIAQLWTDRVDAQ